MSQLPPTIPPPPSARKLRIVQVITLITVIAAMAAALYFRDRIQELRSYGYAAAFVVGVVSSATLVLPIPGVAVTSVIGAVFNPLLVGTIAGIGQAIGELTGYLAGYSGQTLISDSPRYYKLVEWTRRYGMLVIMVLALIPNPVFDVAGITAGVLRMPLWQYLLAATVGKVLKNLVFAYLGYWGLGAL